MQVGDLVTLSAAGNKNKGNDLVRGKMGVIVEISERPETKYPINIRWFNVVHQSQYIQDEEVRDKKSLRKSLTNLSTVIHYECNQQRRNNDNIQNNR